MSNLTYRQLQSTLKAHRANGVVLTCKLNTKKVILAAELIRVENSLLEVEQEATTVRNGYLAMLDNINFKINEFGFINDPRLVRGELFDVVYLEFTYGYITREEMRDLVGYIQDNVRHPEKAADRCSYYPLTH